MVSAALPENAVLPENVAFPENVDRPVRLLPVDVGPAGTLTFRQFLSPGVNS